MNTLPVILLCTVVGGSQVVVTMPPANMLECVSLPHVHTWTDMASAMTMTPIPDSDYILVYAIDGKRYILDKAIDKSQTPVQRDTQTLNVPRYPITVGQH